MRLFKLFMVLMVLSHLGIAQDYQPINSQSVQVFHQETYLTYNGDDDFGFNLWGTRIDSLDISQLGDTVYHVYPILRDTFYEFQSWQGADCPWLGAPNWCGYNPRITVSDTAIFLNMDEIEIPIAFGSEVGA